jgi:Holliday junction resolvasome RuvABC DNA-binding subunit
VVELRDKMEGLEAAAAAPEAAPAGPQDDLVSALVHLGYSRNEADRGVGKALKEGGEGRFEELLRRTLQILSGG